MVESEDPVLGNVGGVSINAEKFDSPPFCGHLQLMTMLAVTLVTSSISSQITPSTKT